MSVPDPMSPAPDGNDRPGPPPARRALGAAGRVLIAVLRIVGVVVAIVGVIVLRFTVRQNPAVGIPIVLAILGGLALVFGAAKVAQLLAEDARREKPSQGIGAFKLVLGLGLALFAIQGLKLNPLSSYHYGLLDAVPFGWKQTLPYAAVVALGGLGILAGVMALAGRRPGWLLRLALVTVTLLGLGLGLPSTCVVRHVAQVDMENTGELVFSHDGAIIAIISDKYSYPKVQLFRTDPLERIREDTSYNDPLEVAVSPDGQRLAVADKTKLTVRNIEGGETLVNVTITDEPVYTACLSFSADGTKVLVAAGKKLATLRDATNGEVISSIDLPAQTDNIAFSPDGNLLAAAGKLSDNKVWIRVWDFASGRQEAEFDWEVRATIEYGTPLCWSPDARSLLVRANEQLALFEPKQGTKIWQAAGPDGSESGNQTAIPAFRADGKRILACLAEGRIEILDAANGQLISHIDQTPAYQAWWTPDGRRLITTGLSADTDLWDISRISDK